MTKNNLRQELYDLAEFYYWSFDEAAVNYYNVYCDACGECIELAPNYFSKLSEEQILDWLLAAMG